MTEKTDNVRKPSLSEQLAELSDPKPTSFHPDQEDLEDITAAKVCSYNHEEEDSERNKEHGGRGRASRRKAIKYLDEDDMKYAGKTISRKELETEYDGLQSASDVSDSEIEESDEDSQENDPRVAMDMSSSDESEAFDQSDDEESDNTSNSESIPPEGASELQSPTDSADDVTMTSLSSIKEDIKKGKAAKEQLALFDGALETRIRLQKVLATCNRLPHPQTMAQFQQLGGQQLEQALKDNQTKLRNLLDSLLGLQKIIFTKNEETQSLVCRGVEESSHVRDEANSDEEIASDSEDDTRENSLSETQSEEQDSSVAVKERLQRKRKRPGWVTSSGRRDYESYIAKTHEDFRSFRNSTIDKWSKKTKIASGKITSKAFVHIEQSALSQIEHVLKDEERLIKRTQLRRSVYRVLGTRDEPTGIKNGNGTSKNVEEMVVEESSGQDKHLHDYDQEIFDDDDFYHQLLRELIERKTNYSETSDPTAMGRQWLELQKLRTKAKKTVDTKASKGRKIRYNIHPKLTNFMAPVNKGSMSDVSKNDLFASLFGGRQLT